VSRGRIWGNAPRNQRNPWIGLGGLMLTTFVAIIKFTIFLGILCGTLVSAAVALWKVFRRRS
jgi:MFS superfamily sulfate permease-like transporter